MIRTAASRSVRWTPGSLHYSLQTPQPWRTISCLFRPNQTSGGRPLTPSLVSHPHRISVSYHSSTPRYAQSPTADALMENLNDLYATAKDEFEIAAEETEKKTVYAADDREAAVDALKMLQEAFQKALKETSPEVSKEIQGRVGPRIRELENAVKAMEEMAMED
ncbi:uncharacterized protein Z520_10442 [Fonsecaea multimorphosa CBS 102226]|uniref:Uncharacterized protein n=1 Tax=Fonsecaea multimorphosa CBS 102226 TaxID=1442371 RepID=A0A0D2JKM8_9EURO|nr:uncharacterized protein Z520_10442 [Fonsecaea multimorphosa CBS 102226]KIX93817.1 hypothetical protein Z520_10442 [Fonsecaea multimorphosa CBS 102226]OAL19057.1 hypothetical protein AYO22_10005 [Fonsecaea multimorphosa]